MVCAFTDKANAIGVSANKLLSFMVFSVLGFDGLGCFRGRSIKQLKLNLNDNYYYLQFDECRLPITLAELRVMR
ncbi:hypothetical protein KUL118_25980 [Tenacibaculum sp. KUL118]|nr:hypothetical protein KUL118_25980 [Tenacibaculum sp. KUL118]